MFGIGLPELILLVILVIPVIIVIALKKRSNKEVGVVNERYQGVGGWLLLLCLGLTVFGPITTIASQASGYTQASQYFDSIPGLMFIIITDLILSLTLMVFSIYAGVGLLRIRHGAVKAAKTYFLCLLAYHLVSAVLPLLAGLPSQVLDGIMTEVGKGIFRGLLYVAIWYSYLSRSLRVRATYGLS